MGTKLKIKTAVLEEANRWAEKAIALQREQIKEHFGQINGLLERQRQRELEFIELTKKFVTTDEHNDVLRRLDGEHNDVLRRLENDNNFRQNVAGRETMANVVWKVLSFFAGLTAMYILKK